VLVAKHALQLPLLYFNFPTYLFEQNKEIKLCLRALTGS